MPLELQMSWFEFQEPDETALHLAVRSVDRTSLHIVDFLVQNRWVSHPSGCLCSYSWGFPARDQMLSLLLGLCCQDAHVSGLNINYGDSLEKPRVKEKAFMVPVRSKI